MIFDNFPKYRPTISYMSSISKKKKTKSHRRYNKVCGVGLPGDRSYPVYPVTTATAEAAAVVYVCIYI